MTSREVINAACGAPKSMTVNVSHFSRNSPGSEPFEKFTAAYQGLSEYAAGNLKPEVMKNE